MSYLPAVVCSPWFEGVASSTESHTLILLGYQRFFVVSRCCIGRCFFGGGDWFGVRWYRSGVGRHRLEVGHTRHGRYGSKGKTMEDPGHCQVTNTFLVLGAHPGRDHDKAHRINRVKMQCVGNKGARQATAVHVQPVLVKGPRAELSTPDRCHRYGTSSSTADARGISFQQAR